MLSLTIAAILFVLYPVLRPFSDESSLQGAAAFASAEWMAAHMLAMIAFTLLPIGLWGLYRSLQQTVVEPMIYWAFVLCQIGTGCILPFYGGETFGLHAIGREAVRQQSDHLVHLEAAVRSGPGLVMFLIGMLFLAVASMLVAFALGKSKSYSRWGGVPFALGMLLYVPQFFAGQPLRVAHGILVAIGCLWLAAELAGQNKGRLDGTQPQPL